MSKRTRAYLGSKSATLETVDLLLPFLTQPKALIGPRFIGSRQPGRDFRVAEKVHRKRSVDFSVHTIPAHYFEAFLQCNIYVKYLRRLSNPVAATADSLSVVTE
jgi:hypothetical protein